MILQGRDNTPPRELLEECMTAMEQAMSVNFWGSITEWMWLEMKMI